MQQTLTLMAWLAAAILLGALTWHVDSAAGPVAAEQSAADWVATWHSETLTALMHALHELQGKAVAVAIVLGLVALAWRRQWRAMITLFAMVPLGMLANSGLKLLVERPRPGLLADIETHGFSYPSGHTAAITLLLGYLLLQTFRGTSRWPWRMLALTGTLALVGTVGFSRVYLGAHHPGDVLASVLFGVVWLGMCLLAEHGFERSARLAAR
jgi:undecaprenyl-diphosphatase